MERELCCIVDNGCIVRDVIVEHPIYGQLTGQLSLRSRFDIQQFVSRASQDDVTPLSALTDGIHLHTILCPDEASFLRVRQALDDGGFLLPEHSA
jgi:transcriptional regulator of NAD metabolism